MYEKYSVRLTQGQTIVGKSTIVGEQLAHVFKCMGLSHSSQQYVPRPVVLMFLTWSVRVDVGYRGCIRTGKA